MSKAWAGGSTWASRKARDYVLSRDRGLCQVRLPGCTTIATESHHTIGKGITGDDPDYQIASCHHCNNKIGDPRTFDPTPRLRKQW